MTWSNTPIDGQQSVAANKDPINNAFTYIGTSMQVDHYWDNANANLDGHHQFVQMPKNGGGTPTNPTRATDMDGVLFCKDKTTADAPDLQIAEPFYLCNDGSNDQILQMGFRAMANFTVGTSSPFTVTEKYIHNCSISRSAVGIYVITFDTAMPTANYIVFGSSIRTSGTNKLYMSVTEQTTASCTVQFQYDGNTVRDVTTAMIAVCGG